MSESIRQRYANAVLSIAEEKPDYRLGGDGSDGTCDCVGAGIGALRRMGIEYDGLHGSNWAARHEAVELWEIENIYELRVGDNVLKAYEPGHAKWQLPDRYDGDPDQRDYYHFGIVTSVNPLEITHCTSPTFKTDTTLGAWRFAFMWRQLSDYVEEEITMKTLYNAKVVLRSGYLNLRAGKGADTRDIGNIPNRAIVEVLEEGEWPLIRYAGQQGYVCGEYLERIEEAEELPAQEPEEAPVATTTLIRDDGTPITLEGVWRVAED